MKKRVKYSLGAGLIAGGLTVGLTLWNTGPGTTVMEKCFLAFFGTIIVLQCVPALLLFGCMVKEVVFRSSKATFDNKSGSETSPS